MKKVININFQGRIIPIEESAYEELKRYTDSLRRYFAREEGKDEIINDIENRIAELFSERLKKNTTGCVTDQDVIEIAASIGRPEDFDETEEVQSKAPAFESATPAAEPRGSLTRNENDKILGGVCSGLAHYLRIDPTIVRILFAIITLGGFGMGILIYIILWIVLPAKSMEINVRRRLYRNPDSKVIGGVCGGISSYLNIPVWIPRLIFALPFFLSIFGNLFNDHWGGFSPFPDIVFGSFGGTLLAAYIILWIVVPMATTASEKLEMRGEKVDLESIKQSVQEELHSSKEKAEKWSGEIKERAQQWGEEVKERGKAFVAETGPAARRAGSGLGNAIGILFKAFFLFVAGIVVFALFVALMALMFSGVGFFPLKNFLLEGVWQNLMAWGTLVLFLGVPILAAVVWLIRRIAGIKSKNNYLGYTFGSLWTIGLICAITLAGLVSRDFKRVGNQREDITITQPTQNRLLVDVTNVDGRFYNISWFDEEDDFPALSANEDSMLLNTVRISITRSRDSNYHAYLIKFARGSSPVLAEETAEKISFPVKQEDSVLYLPKGFAISKESKFRNQQVLCVVQVPVGKMIRMDHKTDWYSWFSVNTSRRRGFNVDFDFEWDYDGFSWRNDVWYVMTNEGLESLDKNDREENRQEKEGEEYRYNKGKDTIDIKIDKKDTTVNIKLTTEAQKKRTFLQQLFAKKVNKEGVMESDAKEYRGSMISVLDVLKVGS